MAKTQINMSVGTPFGPIDIYITDKTKLEKARRLVEKSPQILIDAYEDAARRWGKKVIDTARRCIDTGTPPKGSGVSWPPLSPKYAERWGGNIYYNRAQYYQSMGVHKEDVMVYGTSKTSKRIYIGLPNQVKKITPTGKTSRLTLQKVASILENGSKNGKIPSRPLWGPLYKSMGGKESLKRYIREAIKRQLSKYL